MSYFQKFPNFVSYGTAGFRMNAKKLEPIIFYVGVLASLYSFKTKKIVGVMITASHNEVIDNGVKVVEPNGDCLGTKWEKYAEKLVNSSHTKEDFEKVVAQIKKDEDIQEENGMVYIANDTRPSCDLLFKNLLDGINEMKSKYHSFGILTTPQLHFMVKHDNEHGIKSEDAAPYYKKMAENLQVNISQRFIDCSYGVGATALRNLEKYLGYSLNLLNDDVSKFDHLNHGCGAEYVQKDKKPPLIGDKIQKDFIASFDGDADRIVYSYYLNDKFTIIEGDKMASLFALYFSKFKDLEIGVVQTAYANGSSTKYLQSIVKHVDIEPTGVKHLHHRAKNYDIGIYFEANGHGTVLFSDKALKFFEKEGIHVVSLVNETVGDAISDLLVTETILKELNFTPEIWDSLYQDLPSMQVKMKVKDKSMIKTSYDETKVLEPKGLQDELDKLMEKYPGFRTFVRPSGTEDVIRIYIEGGNDLDSFLKEEKEILAKFL